RRAAAHPPPPGEQCHLRERTRRRYRPARLALLREPAPHGRRLHGCGTAAGHHRQTARRRSGPRAPGGHHRARDAARTADPARHPGRHHGAGRSAAGRAAGPADRRRRGGLYRPGDGRLPHRACSRRGSARVSLGGFVGAVGNTPLIRLRRVSEETGCEILGKAEFMNPGGSVKDRAACAIVLQAERRGELPPGGTVVEGTAGNTGIGLAHVCNARGYRCVIVMPDNQSPEKYQLLETLGAEVHPVPTVPYSNPNQYQKVAQRLAASLPNAIWSNQFDNTANRDAHARTTGPEIWAQTQGRVDAFVAATGTGGTLAGVASYLKSKRPEIRCLLADPRGSSLYEYIRSGTLKATGSGSIT